MFFVYILKSLKTNTHYIGSCEDTKRRLKEHNSGYTKSTKYKRPWIIIYKESFTTREEAYRREKQIKSYKGGDAFKKLISLI